MLGFLEPIDQTRLLKIAKKPEAGGNDASLFRS